MQDAIISTINAMSYSDLYRPSALQSMNYLHRYVFSYDDGQFIFAFFNWPIIFSISKSLRSAS